VTHPRQESDRERFASLLIAGMSISDAATEVGISRTTASRWRASPEVESLLDAHRQEMRAHVSHRLASFVETALDRSERLLEDPDTPPSVIARLLATALAESRLRVDTDEVLRRLEALERHEEPDRLAQEIAR